MTNNGPDAATGVMLTDTLPAGVTFVLATPSQGSCAQEGGAVTCTLGNLGNGASADVTIIVRPTVAGTITNVARVTGNESDRNICNNVAEVTTTVSNPPSNAR